MTKHISCCDFSQSIKKLCFNDDQKSVLVTLGDGSYISEGKLTFSGPHCHVLIGNYSSIAHNVEFIVGSNHNNRLVSNYPFRAIYAHDSSGAVNNDRNHNQVIIGNDVWIGANVTILDGVRIGNGAVVGAGTVVARNVPPYAVVAGNPARVVRYRFSPEVIDSLQRIKWWNWDSVRIKKCWREFENTEEFLCKYSKTSLVDIAGSNHELFLALQELRKKHYKIYYFQPDLSSEDRVWENVLNNILPDLYDEKSIFVMVVCKKKTQSSQEENFLRVVKKFNKPGVIILDSLNTAGLVRLAYCIITTKEHESLQLIDMAGADCKIIYGYAKVKNSVCK